MFDSKKTWSSVFVWELGVRIPFFMSDDTVVPMKEDPHAGTQLTPDICVESFIQWIIHGPKMSKTKLICGRTFEMKYRLEKMQPGQW